ncbi:hypothetical protein ACIG5E_37065 [Kitasatospora sp. NPDC053057]|uniref:hypothetical protein n=1 Tax=Kitasatospora sp. NPDC053057 TaxID=3364062 RepID=UPI0037C70A02
MIYTHGTENSTRTAFGYHVGMTMAEWACRSLMGLGPTTHAESAVPLGASTEWSSAKSLPDLFGSHTMSGELWLVEAKGGRWLALPARKKGAKQLNVGALLPESHRKVLCGASLEKRLFMMIDIEDWPSSSEGPLGDAGAETVDEDSLQGDDEALLGLAQARMLTYLALVSLPRNTLKMTAVGKSQTGHARWRNGLVSLLEDDRETEALRRGLDRDSTGDVIERQQGVDMLVGRLPGTDLMLGMSRRLFGACRELAGLERQLVSEIDAKLPAPMTMDVEAPLVRMSDGEGSVRRSEGRLTDREYERRIAERRESLRESRERERGSLHRAVRRGFSLGNAESWAQLAEVSPQLVLPAEDGFLEAATRDTYLAVEAQALDLELS